MIRREMEGPVIAWCETEDEASIMYWIAPADGAFRVYDEINKTETNVQTIEEGIIWIENLLTEQG